MKVKRQRLLFCCGSASIRSTQRSLMIQKLKLRKNNSFYRFKGQATVAERLVVLYDAGGPGAGCNETQCRAPSRHSPRTCRFPGFQIVQRFRRMQQQMFGRAGPKYDVVPKKLAV